MDEEDDEDDDENDLDIDKEWENLDFLIEN